VKTIVSSSLEERSRGGRGTNPSALILCSPEERRDTEATPNETKMRCSGVRIRSENRRGDERRSKYVALGYLFCCTAMPLLLEYECKSKR
jgi:hypothetical protein